MTDTSREVTHQVIRQFVRVAVPYTARSLMKTGQVARIVEYMALTAKSAIRRICSKEVENLARAVKSTWLAAFSVSISSHAQSIFLAQSDQLLTINGARLALFSFKSSAAFNG